MPASASAFCWTSAPATVTGAMAPERVKGVMVTGWPWRAISMMPISMGASYCRGEFALTTVKMLGSFTRRSESTPRAMRAISIESRMRSRPRQ